MVKPVILMKGDSFIKKLTQYLVDKPVEVCDRRVKCDGMSGATVQRVCSFVYFTVVLNTQSTGKSPKNIDLNAIKKAQLEK